MKKNTQEILQTKICLEQSTKENTQNPTTITTPALVTTQLSTVNTQTCNPLTTMSSESFSVFNTSNTLKGIDGTQKGAIPKQGNKISISKPLVPTGMLRYLNIIKRNLSTQKGMTSAKKQKVNENPLTGNRFALLSDDVNNHSKTIKATANISS